MKALVLESFDAPLYMKAVETPKPGPDEIILKVLA